jgi:ribosomal protein S18 acetylase RimI-like enzyme
LTTGEGAPGGAPSRPGAIRYIARADLAVTEISIQLRPAIRKDARALAELINFAGEGLPLYLWTRLAEPGEDVWEVGRSRALRDEGGFSYRNSTIAELGGEVAGCLIGYALAKEPARTDLASLPPVFVPLQELEELAPNTWYINVVAAYPKFRGQGVGSRLLERAEQAAREADRPGLSLVVADTNVGARKLYAKRGYRQIATRPLVKEQWQTGAREWVLMVKSIED